MTAFTVDPRSVPALVAAGRATSPYANRLGMLGFTPQAEEMIALGYGFGFDIGALNTGIVGGGNGTVLDLDQPEGCISVPSGTAIKLYRVDVTTYPPLIAADSDKLDILLAADRTAAWAGDGTVTAETIYNMRVSATNPKSSNCSAFSAATADITDPVLGIEIARVSKMGDVQGTATNALYHDLQLNYRPLGTGETFVGPCAVYLYWGGTVAVTGFANIRWIEYQSPDFYSIVVPS